MGSEILHAGASGACPHSSGQLSISAAGAARVKVSGNAVVTASDNFSISSCQFQVPVGAGTKPQPCVSVTWTVPATRVKTGGKAVLLKSSASSAICQSADQIPAGPPSIKSTQTKAKGT